MLLKTQLYCKKKKPIEIILVNTVLIMSGVNHSREIKPYKHREAAFEHFDAEEWLLAG